MSTASGTPQVDKLPPSLVPLLATIAENVEAPIYVSDIQSHRVLYANEAVRRDVGDVGDVVGRLCWEVLQAGQTGPCPFCTNSRLLDAQGRPTGTVTWEHQNTRTGRWYECRDRAIPWEAGRLVRMEVAVDITERRLLEASLRESEAELRAFAEHSHAAFGMTDTQGRLTDINAAAERILGVSRSAVVGRFAWEFLPAAVFPESDPETEESVREALAAGRASWLGRVREVSVSRPDGSRAHCLRVVFAIPTSGGFRLATVTHDVTELRSAQEALRASERRLEAAQRLEAVGTLAAGMAHYFNNYLSVICGNAALLDRPTVGAEDRRELARSIASAGARAAELNRKLLGYSARRALSARAMEVSPLLEHLVGRIREAVGRSIRVEAEIGPELGKASIDPWLLEQALLAVAANARDACVQDGTLTVTARRLPAAGGGEVVEIRLADDGPGMDEETAARVFEPFFTTRKLGMREGLGMSMALGIVEQHGGTIGCRSAPGLGTTITIQLPRLPGGTP